MVLEAGLGLLPGLEHLGLRLLQDLLELLRRFLVGLFEHLGGGDACTG